MKLTSATIALAVCAALAPAPVPAASTGLGGLSGRVRDASGAALPGVVVTASCARHESLATTVTNGHGEYALEGLPPGACSVAFELAGFEPKATPGVMLEPDRTAVLDNELALAPMNETVEVFAQRPPEPNPLPLPPPPIVTPALQAVPHYDLSAVCGPSLHTGATPPIAHLVAAKLDVHRRNYTKGDTIVLDGGQGAGLKVGDNFVVRRQFEAVSAKADARDTLVGEHSSGLIQVTNVRGDTAEAVVVFACDAFRADDYLVPFVPSVIGKTQGRGRPDFDVAGRILFADEGQSIGAPQRLMVTDFGQNRGAQPGQRLTVFRIPEGRRPIIEIGEAVVVAVAQESATIRIEYATDAIYFGDRVAVQR